LNHHVFPGNLPQKNIRTIMTGLVRQDSVKLSIFRKSRWRNFVWHKARLKGVQYKKVINKIVKGIF